MNTRYKLLLNIEFRKLLSAFEESKHLFQNKNVKNNLLHPGEYGFYRERACKDFLKFILPNKFKVGDGFIINSFDKETTQCDLIIYESDITPVIKIDDHTRFFPCESVLAIGEVKSSLKKDDLFKCLKKLATNKQIRKIRNDSLVINTVESNPENCFSDLFTFLICESIESFNENLKNELLDFYTRENIPAKYQHNFILSLNDGYIGYKLTKENLEYLKLKISDYSFFDSIKDHIQWFPAFNDEIVLSPTIVKNSSTHHHIFTSTLTNFLKNSITYYPDPTFYLS